MVWYGKCMPQMHTSLSTQRVGPTKLRRALHSQRSTTIAIFTSILHQLPATLAPDRE